MKRYIVLLTLVVVGLSYGQRSFTSVNLNGYNILTTSGKETTATTNTVYTSAFNGSSINGQKIVVTWLVTDSTTEANTTNAQARVDLQATVDGTNYFNVYDSIVTSKRFNGSAALTTVRAGSIVDLSSYNYPSYRLAFVPTNGTLGAASNGAAIKCPKFKFRIAGAK